MNLYPRSPSLGRRLLCGALLTSCAACAKVAPQAPQPVTPAELMQRGAFLASQGDDFAAEQYLEAARSAGCDERLVVRELVRVCVAAGRLEHALLHAESYLERTPEDWLLQHVIATIHFAKGDGMRARDELELLLSEHPDHAESHFLLGMVLRDTYSDVPGTRAAFERYLALAPEGEHASEARAYIRRSSRFPVEVEGGHARLEEATP